MPKLASHAAPLIELLSLAHTPDGCILEVGLTGDSGYSRRTLAVDDYTYAQIHALGSFGKTRVRMSLYPKWDPFQNTYFSSLVKVGGSVRETLHFACSAAFAERLQELRAPLAPAEPLAEATVAAFPAETAGKAQPQAAQRAYRLQPFALRSLLFALLIAVFLLRMDGGWFGGSAEAHKETAAYAKPVPAAALAVAAPTQHAVLLKSGPASPPDLPVQLQPSASPAAAEPAEPPVKVIALPADHYEYGLPEGYVALTFDDGPSRYTKDIVDVLVQHGVAANFLFVGQNAQKHPQETAYALTQGMPVGSHSWDHSDLTRGSAESSRANLAKANATLKQLTGAPVTVFRPPYGAINDTLARTAEEQHLKVLLWNRDPEDWKADDKEQILDYFHHTDASGGIYLLHEKSLTLQALPEIIEYLQSQGLKFAVFQ